MSKEVCRYCKKPILGALVSAGGGLWAHRRCFELRHPPKKCKTIFEVARGVADPMIAAEVITELVPPELAQQIVDEHNRRTHNLWLRLCKP